MYSFGILGIKSIIDSIHYRSWLNTVLEGQGVLKQQLEQGTVAYHLKPGFSVLFVGKGDFIGMQFVLRHSSNTTFILSERKQKYTNVWNKYVNDDHYSNLNTIMTRSYLQSAGEYILFPVKDDQIFLPSQSAYDIPPYQIDLLYQDIRSIEQKTSGRQSRLLSLVIDTMRVKSTLRTVKNKLRELKNLFHLKKLPSVIVVFLLSIHRI